MSADAAAASAANRWELAPSPKYTTEGVERVVPPEETIRRVRRLMPKVGVTRIGSITHLDRVRIPNFVAARPLDALPGISFYSGKGATAPQARAGAMMEAIERYSAESCDLSTHRCTYEEILRNGDAVHPSDIIAPRVRGYTSDSPTEWVEGYDLVAEVPTYVPLNAVVFPYRPADGGALFYSSTNGLASGNTIEEALCHAICEVVERDAVSMARTRLWLSPKVAGILSSLQRGAPQVPKALGIHYPLISLKGLPLRASRLIGKLQRADLRVYLRNITNELNIPTIECTIIDEGNGDGRIAHGGCGTHPDARVALMRAITEAAQSRVVHIQGGREDLSEIAEDKASVDYEKYFGGGEVCRFSDIPSYEHARVDEDIRFMLDNLRGSELGRVVAVELTRPELKVPVVRVIIPKAETWNMFRLHTSRGEFGPRVRRLLTHATSG
jgi:ribosomal protein S12 methylthiotransferase accessory factor YcaO